MAQHLSRDAQRSNNRQRRDDAGGFFARRQPGTSEAETTLALVSHDSGVPAERGAVVATSFPTSDVQQAIAIHFAQCRDDGLSLPWHSWWYRASKRVFDVAFSIIALTVFSPVILLIALLVRLDSPGPAIFVQQRIGYRGHVFGMLKFRTMIEFDSELVDGSVHKLGDDPRLTRVGRFLRATSFDELPQLFNVLRGEMSLVGPRPEIVAVALAHYEPWQYQRLLVPQGMTGWWQVTGRGAKLLREHTEDDLYYIERASFWFDLEILFMTIGAVLRREGAF